MRIERGFNPLTERYAFDGKECSAKNGYAQVDTKQDASYYGTWANPTSFTIVCYAEGDITRTYCDNAEEFVKEIRELKEWSEGLGYWLGIDPGWAVDGPIERAFRELGLGDLLH